MNNKITIKDILDNKIGIKTPTEEIMSDVVNKLSNILGVSDYEESLGRCEDPFWLDYEENTIVYVDCRDWDYDCSRYSLEYELVDYTDEIKELLDREIQKKTANEFVEDYLSNISDTFINNGNLKKHKYIRFKIMTSIVDEYVLICVSNQEQFDKLNRVIQANVSFKESKYEIDIVLLEEKEHEKYE